MPQGQVKTKCFEKFLLSHGCKPRKSTSQKGSHKHYRCPDCKRTITFRPAYKEMPLIHVRTNLSTMGIKMDDFQKWVKDEC